MASRSMPLDRRGDNGKRSAAPAAGGPSRCDIESPVRSLNETRRSKQLTILSLQRSEPSMAFRHSIPICAAFGLAIVLAGGSGAEAQTLHPIPAAECQQLAAKAQAAIGIPMRAGEDDFSDVVGRAEGRACHIT